MASHWSQLHLLNTTAELKSPPLKVAVIITGKLRLASEESFEKIRQATNETDVFVVTYIPFLHLGNRLARHHLERVLLFDDPRHGTRGRTKVPQLKADVANPPFPEMWQWLLLKAGLEHWRTALLGANPVEGGVGEERGGTEGGNEHTYHTLVRFRTDMHFPETFSFTHCVGRDASPPLTANSARSSARENPMAMIKSSSSLQYAAAVAAAVAPTPPQLGSASPSPPSKLLLAVLGRTTPGPFSGGIVYAASDAFFYATPSVFYGVFESMYDESVLRYRHPPDQATREAFLSHLLASSLPPLADPLHPAPLRHHHGHDPDPGSLLVVGAALKQMCLPSSLYAPPQEMHDTHSPLHLGQHAVVTFPKHTALPPAASLSESTRTEKKKKKKKKTKKKGGQGIQKNGRSTVIVVGAPPPPSALVSGAASNGSGAAAAAAEEAAVFATDNALRPGRSIETGGDERDGGGSNQRAGVVLNPQTDYNLKETVLGGEAPNKNAAGGARRGGRPNPHRRGPRSRRSKSVRRRRLAKHRKRRRRLRRQLGVVAKKPNSGAVGAVKLFCGCKFGVLAPASVAAAAAAAAAGKLPKQPLWRRDGYSPKVFQAEPSMAYHVLRQGSSCLPLDLPRRAEFRLDGDVIERRHAFTFGLNMTSDDDDENNAGKDASRGGAGNSDGR